MRGFHFVGREVAASPDDVAVAAALDPARHGGAPFLLAGAVMRIHRLDRRDAVAVPLEPPDLADRDVRIDDEAVRILPIAHHHDPELGAERRQVTAVASPDRDMEHCHGMPND